MTTSVPAGILRNRAAVLAALVFCIYEASPRSFTTLHFGVKSPDARDPLLLIGLLVSVVIGASVAQRSPLRADKFVFGAAVPAAILWLIRSLTPPGTLLTSII